MHVFLTLSLPKNLFDLEPKTEKGFISLSYPILSRFSALWSISSSLPVEYFYAEQSWEFIKEK